MAEQSTDSRGDPSAQDWKHSTAREASLWVELEIDHYRTESCPISGFANTDAHGHIQLVGNQCHSAVASESTGGEEKISLYEVEITDDCICPILCGPGLLPVKLSFERGSLAVHAYVDTRDRLTQLIDALRDTESVWRLRRLTSPDGSRWEDFGRFGTYPEDITLTDKQREAIRTAEEMGYYDTPRRVSLSDLASQIGVSTSALSQRLNAVEAKLIESLVAEI